MQAQFCNFNMFLDLELLLVLLAAMAKGIFVSKMYMQLFNILYSWEVYSLDLFTWITVVF